MPFLETKDKQKSAALTTVIAVLIIFLIFNFGMTYFDPPKEYGIAINFGINDFGSGNVQPTEALKPAKQEIVEEEQVEEQMEEEVVEEQLEESTPIQNDAAEDVITQNNEDTIAIKKKEEAKKKKEEKKRAEDERKAKEAKREGVNNMVAVFSNNDGKANGGEGDDNKAGDKGKASGNPYAIGNNGTGGSGGNYSLGDRKAKFQPDPIDDCVNEFGVVVVNIQVDQKGNVIKTSGPARGTKNSSPCLLSRAKEAALKSKFNQSSKAPEIQTGTITYNFKQGKKEDN